MEKQFIQLPSGKRIRKTLLKSILALNTPDPRNEREPHIIPLIVEGKRETLGVTYADYVYIYAIIGEYTDKPEDEPVTIGLPNTSYNSSDPVGIRILRTLLGSNITDKRNGFSIGSVLFGDAYANDSIDGNYIRNFLYPMGLADRTYEGSYATRWYITELGIKALKEHDAKNKTNR